METASAASSLQLASSNESVRLPASVSIRPGQSTARFQIDAVPPSGSDATTITASLGASMVTQTVSLDAQRGSLDAPGHIYAKFGIPVQFRVSSSPPLPVATLTAQGLPAGAVLDPAAGALRWVPDVGQVGRHRIVFTAADPSGDSVTASTVIDVDSGTPVITHVVNAASQSADAACSPGAVGRLEGRWLTEGPATSDSTGQSTELSGTVVKVNGTIVPILSVSLSRIDFLCPEAAAGSTLEIDLQTPTAVAQPVKTVSRAAAPGVFSMDESGTGQGMITHSGTATLAMIPNYRYQSLAALPDESVTLYSTGIEATQQISVIVGGIEVIPESVTAVTVLAGMYQVSFRLPSGLADGDVDVSLKIRLADGTTVGSNHVLVATENTQR
jgi:uncharacterized protein (TIGR03437 family)